MVDEPGMKRFLVSLRIEDLIEILRNGDLEVKEISYR